MSSQENLDTYWKKVDEQIERSTIKRFPYKHYLGCSLTEFILDRALEGNEQEAILVDILTNEKFQKMLEAFKDDKKKLIENVNISICARLGETNTQNKVRSNYD